MIPLSPPPTIIFNSILFLSGFVFLFVFVSIPLQIKAMKVHPVSMKRSLAIRDENQTLMTGNASKKLRRLPHVFSKVLELPFSSQADVLIEESSDCLRFIAEIEGGDGVGGEVKAHAVEILPGVTKIVVRRGGGGGRERVELLLDKLEVDAWRFRLPPTARPELARAVIVGGELIVTVPKRGGAGIEPEVWGGMSRLVIVQ